jgi:hypothetical protein
MHKKKVWNVTQGISLVKNTKNIYLFGNLFGY